MDLSVFDIYKIGIGPSSSHTFGPMIAANRFIKTLRDRGVIKKVKSLKIDLFGSFALTGAGHGTFLALELGLEGYSPETINPRKIDDMVEEILDSKKLNLGGENIIRYNRYEDLVQHKKKELPYHSNAFTLEVFDGSGASLYQQTYYSIGGGFVLDQDQVDNPQTDLDKKVDLKYKFKNFKELLAICNEKNKHITEILLENEKCFRSEEEINSRIERIIEVLDESITNGLSREGVMPGKLHLPRRSPNLFRQLRNEGEGNPLNVFDWVVTWAMGAAEENASYGRVVTAPTNGACSVIPAVIRFVKVYQPELYNFENLRRFILVSGVVGMFCKVNASISGAEGGCQAEIGSACCMASGGLAALNGGTNLQCENAAVIGMVQNMGLTCDPIGGLVQIPCIERNAAGAIKAIMAARIAIREEKSLFITLDQAILTMKQIGRDMNYKYRETALGGLAINSAEGRETYAPCDSCGEECSFSKGS